MSELTVLSLGWGVQSFTLAAMVALGELPPVDFAIHSDTTHEYSATYKFIETWRPWLQSRGVVVVDVVAENTDVLKNGRETAIPAFTVNNKSGTTGMLRRQCTDRWKIRPVRKYLRTLKAKKVNQWIGISWDELQRMKVSDVKWIDNSYPLIEKRMTRLDCVNWLNRNGLETPPKSSCVFCPYHNYAAWETMKESHPLDFHRAALADAAIRSIRPEYSVYVHPSTRPLIELRTSSDFGAEQLYLWDAECSGFCFV